MLSSVVWENTPRIARITRIKALLLKTVPVATGLVLFGLVFNRLGSENVLHLLAQSGWGFFGMVLIFALQEMVRAAGVIESLSSFSRPTFKDMLHIRFVGEGVRALTLTGPFLAEPTRAWFIGKHGVRSHDAAAATIADFVVHSLVSAVFTILATYYFIEVVRTPGISRIVARILLYGSMGYLALASAVWYRRIRVIGPIAGGLACLPGLRNLLCGRVEGVRRTEETLHTVLRDRPRTLVTLVLLQFLSHLLLFLEAYWGIVSMGIDVSFLTAALSEVLTKVANIALFGASEGAYAVMFAALGLPGAVGFALSVLKRARSLAVAGIGMGSLALLSLRQTRV